MHGQYVSVRKAVVYDVFARGVQEIEVVINRDDEEFYRRAAKHITERYNAYAQAYKGRKSDHVIALMTLIDIALMYQKERGHNDTLPYDNVLARLTKEIEDALGGQK
jgi:cell division protein ZapA